MPEKDWSYVLLVEVDMSVSADNLQGLAANHICISYDQIKEPS